MAEHPWSYKSEISCKLIMKILRNLEFKVGLCLGFLRRDDNEPVIALLDQISADFNRCEVLMAQRHVAQKRDHQPVSVLYSISHRDRGICRYGAFLHELHAEIDELHTGDYRSGGVSPAEPQSRDGS